MVVMLGMERGRRLSACRLAIALAMVCVMAQAGAQSSAWKPDKVVEIIVGTAPGAAPDKTARTIQRIWQARGIFDGTVSVVNKPGGGNLIAWNYLNQHAGNGHYLMIGNLNVIISRAIGISPYAHTDYAWIAMLFDEFFAVSVRADSPLASGRDLVARLLKDAGSVTIGVSTSIGGANHLSAALALQRAGIDSRRVKFVAFKGSADSITALLGGHVDAVSSAVSAVVPHVRSGQLRTIAVSAPKRLGEPLATVPTWAEQGINGTMTNFRAVIAPKGTGAGPTAFWERRFAQLSETDEWKTDLERNLWSWNFLDSANTAATVSASAAEVEALVGTLGLRKLP
ncbi:MAG: tripartite tricarboxylate transporter substrate binding protein [Burkholderiales bacterium]|nr:tripartite tricarboxylate transporter substrate binding protein [Burkholderiales bacterium]